MSRLTEWIFAGTIFISIWLGFLFNFDFTGYTKLIVYSLPLLFVVAFGLVSLVILVYRVLTFNNCDDAANELKNEIEEARKDLKSKGFKFD